MENFLDRMSWELLAIACLTIGLAPFHPPHIWEKLTMLLQGRLVRPLDWVDFLFHGIPWVLLLLKALYSLKGK